MPRINRKTANPVLLFEYKRLRYERIIKKLLVAGAVAPIVALVIGAGIVCFLSGDTERIALYLWVILTILFYIVQLTTIVMIAPSETRMDAARIVLPAYGLMLLVGIAGFVVISIY